MDAGKVIRERREQANLTQEEVAVALGVSFGAVSQWETGRTHPRRTVALKLDGLLHAGGTIAAALGYVTPTAEDPTSRKMDDLDRRMAALEARLPPAPPVVTASPEVVRNARKPRPAHSE